MEGDAVSRDLKRIKVQANGFKKQAEKIDNQHIDPTNELQEERKFNFTTSEEEEKKESAAAAGSSSGQEESK